MSDDDMNTGDRKWDDGSDGLEGRGYTMSKGSGGGIMKKTSYTPKKNVYTQPHIRERYRQLSIRLPADGDLTREVIAAAAESAGYSVDAYILEAVRERMARDQAGEEAVAPAHEADCDCELCRIYRFPNAKTRKAIKEGKDGGGEVFDSADALFESWDSL